MVVTKFDMFLGTQLKFLLKADAAVVTGADLDAVLQGAIKVDAALKAAASEVKTFKASG